MSFSVLCSSPQAFSTTGFEGVLLIPAVSISAWTIPGVAASRPVKALPPAVISRQPLPQLPLRGPQWRPPRLAALRYGPWTDQHVLPILCLSKATVGAAKHFVHSKLRVLDGS